MQREKMTTGFQSGGSEGGSGWPDVLHKAEQTIRRFRGRNIKAMSPRDKDALIASLSTIIIASAHGVRPSASVNQYVTQVTLPD